MNGESADAPLGFAGTTVAALDLVFIGVVAESLDFLSGDFFREAVVAVWALVAGRFRAGPEADFFAAGLALVFGAAGDLADALVADRPFVPADLPGVVFALPGAGRFAAAFFTAAFFTVAFFAVALLAGAFFAGDFLTGAFFAAAFFAAGFFAAAFLVGTFFAAACLTGACLPAFRMGLEGDFAAALVRGFLGVFAPDFAAMFCLWFLTFGPCLVGRARETSDAGKSKGA